MIYQIQSEDIGKKTLTLGGQHINLPTVLVSQDVGRRLRHRTNKKPFVTLETDEQFIARQRSEAVAPVARKAAFSA